MRWSSVLARKIFIIVRELDRRSGMTHGASLTRIAKKNQRTQGRHACNVWRVRCQENRQRALIILVVFGTLKQVAIDRLERGLV
jgi:hypothetical protein